MARQFEISGTFQKKIAEKLRPQLARIAREIADDARENAPRDKMWQRSEDYDSRDEHREAHGKTVPSNLRFTLRTPEYDRVFYLAKEFQMGPRPRVVDWTGVNGFTSGLTVNCHCEPIPLESSMLAEKIESHVTVAEGGRIRATVTCDHPLAEAAEFGNSVDDGARFMGQAIREAARKLGVRRIASR